MPTEMHKRGICPAVAVYSRQCTEKGQQELSIEQLFLKQHELLIHPRVCGASS